MDLAAPGNLIQSSGTYRAPVLDMLECLYRNTSHLSDPNHLAKGLSLSQGPNLRLSQNRRLSNPIVKGLLHFRSYAQECCWVQCFDERPVCKHTEFYRAAIFIACMTILPLFKTLVPAPLCKGARNEAEHFEYSHRRMWR